MIRPTRINRRVHGGATGTNPAKRAGYKEKAAYATGAENLRKPQIIAYIEERQKQIEDSRIASAAEIMQYFTSVMRGEVKDQFGLEAPLAERTKAAVELAKRKVDVAQKTDTGGIVIVNNIPRTGKE